MKKLKRPSDRNYKIYREYRDYKKGVKNGKKVDDLVYEYELSYSRIYQIIKEVERYINSQKMISYNQEELQTCYAGEWASKCTVDCQKLYKIALAILIESVKEDVLTNLQKAELEDTNMKVDISEWIKKKPGRRNRKGKLVAELLGLKMYIHFWDSMLLQMNFGIHNVNIRVFDMVKIENDVLMFSFTKEAKTYFVFEYYRSLNEGIFIVGAS